jgi:hypothetical protein
MVWDALSQMTFRLNMRGTRHKIRRQDCIVFSHTKSCVCGLQMRSLEQQNEAIAGFLVSGDASRLSTPARAQPRRRRHGCGGAPSDIGCAHCYC